MGIKFGEIDATQILQNEFRIGVLEHLLQDIVTNNTHLTLPSQERIAEIRQKVIEGLKKKYPSSGIEWKGGK